MILLKRLSHLILAFVFLSSTVHAQGIAELNELILTGDLYGRSSVDFRKNSKNVQFTIPEGSKGTILETRYLSGTGSYGVKIRITEVNGQRGKNTPKVGDETWVYFSQKDPWLTFKDKGGADVDDPELALFARARRDGAGIKEEGVAPLPSLPTKQDVLKNQKPVVSEDPNLAKNTDPKKTEGDVCLTCDSTPPSVTKKNQEDIKTVGREISGDTEKTVPDETWSQFPEVAKYSTSPEVGKTIAYGMRNKKPRSIRLCYRYVKRALLGGDLVDDYLPGSKARYGIADLKRRGFTNMMADPRYKDLIKKPEDAPKGAILVYRNTRDAKHAGHIEIKTDWGKNGGYVSDFYRSNNQSLHNRELIGVMIKEK